MVLRAWFGTFTVCLFRAEAFGAGLSESSELRSKLLDAGSLALALCDSSVRGNRVDASLSEEGSSVLGKLKAAEAAGRGGDEKLGARKGRGSPGGLSGGADMGDR